ncbi:MAG: hypothetical protein A3G87_06990 [Omnitrophica bacterium RIFCSPLOWO2_12_FULL_50_11]|nr:MAG: hypothetical protein A3G87_06990 [Omnitrophica bacterium RIFCSPLOWO2_12_FULL_50_11]
MISKRHVCYWLLLVFYAPLALARTEDPPLLPTSFPLPLPQAEELTRAVHVAIFVGRPSVSIRVGDPFEIRATADQRLIFQGKGPFEASIQAQAQGIQVNSETYEVDSFILSTKGESIQVGTKSYRGQIRIAKTPQNALTVVNEVDLEEYVKGVLPVEASADWPMESLKAHAVVSRTFAVFKMIEKKSEPFALRDTVLSQMYGGSLVHQQATDQAVEATRGEVLTFKGQIFPAYFHAACGGRTADADLIWPVEPHPTLKGRLCHFCQGTKHYQWTLEIPLAGVEEVMQKNGYPAKNLKHLSFLDRDASGRVRTVTLEYARSEVNIPAGDFRTFLGYDRLRSLKADVEIENGRAKFRGFGWGHGVGFCQWGARGQAELGKSYQEILQFYFPASDLTRT